MSRAYSTPSNNERSAHTQPQRKPTNGRLAPQATPLILQRAQVDPASLTVTDVQQLQRSIGNRAVTRLLRRSSEPPTPPHSAEPVIQRAILPIKTNDAADDAAIDYGVQFLDEGKRNKSTGKIEANARGKILSANAFSELLTLTDMNETIYIVAHSDGVTIAGQGPLEMATALHQNLPAAYQGKIVLIACKTAEFTNTWGTGADALREKAPSALTAEDKQKIKKHAIARTKGYDIPLAQNLQALSTTFAQAVAIRLHQLRSASGTLPASVQGFKGTGSLLAQVGGNALGIEQSARMMVKTPEAKQKIDSNYNQWKQDIYNKATAALTRRQNFVPGVVPERSKFKQFTNTVGITQQAQKKLPIFQNEAWFPLVPLEVQQALDPAQTPSKADYDLAYAALERASVQKLNELFALYGRFGKQAKGIYSVSATGAEVQKGRNRRKAVGQKQKPQPKQPVATPPVSNTIVNDTTVSNTTVSNTTVSNTTSATVTAPDMQSNESLQTPPTKDLDVEGVALPIAPTNSDEKEDGA